MKTETADDAAPKFMPLITTVTDADPGETILGDIEVIAGDVIAIIPTVFETPPPGAGFETAIV